MQFNLQMNIAGYFHIHNNMRVEIFDKIQRIYHTD